jgi:hypothetical protein
MKVLSLEKSGGEGRKEAEEVMKARALSHG